MRRMLVSLLLALVVVMAVAPAAGAAGKNRVYVVHVDEFQSIDPWVAKMTERIIARAEADPDAAAIVILIDTPGGLVVSALKMKEVILASRVKTVAFVKDNALSAGALIATAAEKLYMHPGSVIGAAEPRRQGSNEAADYKTVSAVVGAFTSTAQARGRDPKIAQAMVDKNAKLPGQTTELLTLTFQDAIDKRYADGAARDLDDALKQAGLTSYDLVDSPPVLSDRLGRLLTTPWVATLLLVVGVVAIGIEFMKPGVTLPGLVGVVSLGLFFLGNVLVGTAGWLELTLALLGVLLLVIEALIPGFGVFGIGGVVAIVASIFLSVPSTDLALRYLMFASLSFVGVLFALVRTISQKGLGKALTLEQDSRGYLPARSDLSGLVGREGKALTVLRPAGTAQFEDAKVDVVTEGEFLNAGARVAVVRVEGTRVVVRALDQ